jgi:Flp pilus assembly protein TadD
MKITVRSKRTVVLEFSIIAVMAAGCLLYLRLCGPDRYFSAFSNNRITGPAISVIYPFDGTLFPPEICAPTIRWTDPNHGVKKWLISIVFEDGSARIDHFCDSLTWTPSVGQWQTIKSHSVKQKATIIVIGIRSWHAVSCGRADLHTSTDVVGAPLFYREVTLPFKEAVKDPSKIRWRFGSITKGTCPPVVLENLPVCGNCHSFSADGKTLGMDVDYANDKGSYAIVPVATSMTLDTSDIITWNDYRKQDKQPTFGLLSQVSPDGRWVASTVKDLSVFVPKPQLDFSQLFFPVKGIIALFDRTTRAFSELPGANDPTFVNSNPVWSPDGKRILFIRSKVYNLNLKKGPQQVLLSEEQCADFLKNGKLFLYDICQVPFNDGKGGQATPLIGASENGMSNYFPRFSPDGKWVVFCRARSFSLLQPDSKLYIVPSQGGTPRLMNCNRDLMNPWHCWSPNGKWIVFSSKTFSSYTQLFLTHIDDHGMDTPPVALGWLTSSDRAANIPEFVNAPDTAIKGIHEHFVNDISYMRAAREYVVAYDFSGTILNLFHKALEINPKNAQAHYDLGTILATQHKEDEAEEHFQEAIRLDSNLLMAYCNLATSYAFKGRLDDAASYYEKAIARNIGKAGRMPKSEPAPEAENTQALIYAHTNLALIYVKAGAYAKAIREYGMAMKIDRSSPDLYCGLGDIYLLQDKFQEAKSAYGRAIELKPDFERACYNLGMVFQKLNQPRKAADAWEKVLKINPDNENARKNLQTAPSRE